MKLSVKTQHAVPWLMLFAALLGSSSSYGKCVGVVTAGGGVDFWQHVAKGAIQAGTENFIEVIVRGPKDAATADTQTKIVEYMVEIGCKSLVVAPNDQRGLSQLVELRSKGIDSVLIDRDFGSKQFTVIKTNNYKAGVMAANAMGELLPSNSNIALLKLSTHVSSTTDRENGFLETMTNIGANIVVNQYLGTDRTEATTNAYKILTENANIDGVFTPNESTTLAVLNSLKRLSSDRKMIHIGFDSHPAFLRAIQQDELSAIVTQKPFEMGYLAVTEVLRMRQETKDIQQMERKYIETPVLLLNKKQSMKNC